MKESNTMNLDRFQATNAILARSHFGDDEATLARICDTCLGELSEFNVTTCFDCQRKAASKPKPTQTP